MGEDLGDPGVDKNMLLKDNVLFGNRTLLKMKLKSLSASRTVP